jgi:UDP-hydrolysing UDP-N-acetyl-D-glucosamine 2-epimerase
MTPRRRSIAVVTVGRSDYGIYRPVLAALAARDDVAHGLVVAAAHLVAAHGDGLAGIARDGHPILEHVDMLLASDSPEATALSMGLGLAGFARAFVRLRPDLLILLGDRFEMFAAAAAAVPLGIPLMHLHGGEVTEGAMDERFRHAISKLSHLHCVATERSAERVRQMGEEAWRVHVTGAPGLDAMLAEPPCDRAAFFAGLGMPDPGRFLLATWHPVTTEPDPEGRQIAAVLAALKATGLAVLFTTANADPGGQAINDRLWAEAAADPEGFRVVRSLGRFYASAMAHAEVMVGNSSSGIIEACSHGLPVVNIGRRQEGRERSANVIDCACDAAAIAAALDVATKPSIRAAARRAVNVYGDGRAAPRIAAVAAETVLDARLLLKKFARPDGSLDGTGRPLEHDALR